MYRNAHLDDIDSIIALESAAYGIPPMIVQAQMPFMRQEWMQAIGGDQVLCLDNPEGALIGAIHVSERDVTSAGSERTLVSLMVSPEAQRSGHGGALLRSFLDVCDQSGHTAALKVAPTNTGAIHLYQRSGFKKTGREDGGLLRMVRDPNPEGDTLEL